MKNTQSMGVCEKTRELFIMKFIYCEYEYYNCEYYDLPSIKSLNKKHFFRMRRKNNFHRLNVRRKKKTWEITKFMERDLSSNKISVRFCCVWCISASILVEERQLCAFSYPLHGRNKFTWIWSYKLHLKHQLIK